MPQPSNPSSTSSSHQTNFTTTSSSSTYPSTISLFLFQFPSKQAISTQKIHNLHLSLIRTTVTVFNLTAPALSVLKPCHRELVTKPGFRFRSTL